MTFLGLKSSSPRAETNENLYREFFLWDRNSSDKVVGYARLRDHLERVKLAKDIITTKCLTMVSNFN